VTLLELLVVLMILSLILTAAVKTWDVTLERGRSETTSRKLNQLVTVIVGDRDYIVAGRRVDFGFVGDVGRLPDNLGELTVSPPISPPESSRWRGPYLRATFNESPDGFRVDGWGDTIIYSPESLFVRSLGGRGEADKTRWQTVFLPYDRRDLTQNTIDGDIVDVRGRSPTDTAVIDNLTLTLYYPYNGTLIAWPLVGFNGKLPKGHFSFENMVPQGTHRLHAEYIKYIPLRDTVKTDVDVTVYPHIGAHGIRMRLNVDWNDEP
jgi:type II secretory pathway pseudopilin PulG